MIFGCYSFLPNLIKVSSGHSKNRKALMPPALCPIHIQLSSCVIPAMCAYLLPIWKYFHFLFGNIVKAPASRPLSPDGKSSLLGYIDDLVFVICFQY